MLTSPGKEDAGDVSTGRRIAVYFLAAVLAAAMVGCAPKRILLDTDVGASGKEPVAADDLGRRVVELAKTQIGTPYAFGGCRPEDGFDCSGLVQWAYGRCGMPLPRSVDEQAQAGRPVDAADLRPGDLVFFAIDGHAGPDHVGIYVEKHRFVHAPRSGNVVRTESLNDAWWRRRWTFSRRLN
jgi:cell wall-associated NlpC family hydrolase